MKKRYIFIICFFAVLVLFSTIKGALAKYTSEVSGDVNVEIAKWLVKVNDTDITLKGEDYKFREFPIDTIEWKNIPGASVLVEDGYIAPGRAGSFEIVLDFSECETALDYYVSIDFDTLNQYIADKIEEYKIDADIYNPDQVIESGFKITQITKQINEGQPNKVELTDGVYSDTVLLDKIKDKITLKVDVQWNLDGNNELDKILSNTYDAKLNIPVSVRTVQKVGA